jgi:RecB family exonuclease
MTARTLIVCRTRAEQRTVLRRGEGGVGDLVWTTSDLWERLSMWACLRDGVSRDDLGVRLLGASVLAGTGDGGSAGLPRLAPALDSLRRELTMARTSANELLDALGEDLHADDDDPGRRADVRRLLKQVATVERALTERRVVDDSLARARALAALRAGSRPAFLADVTAVQLHLPVDLTALDMAIVGELAAFVPVRVTLPVDNAPGRDVVSGVDAIFRKLEASPQAALGAGGGLEVAGVDVVGDGPLAAFRAALFTDQQDLDADVSVVLAADAQEEARLAVGAVLEFRHRHPEASVAVVARRVELLTPVQEALQHADVTVRRRRRTLLESPAARLLLDVAALRLDDVPRDRLLAVLMNPARRGALLPDDAARVLATLRRAAVRRDAEDATRPVGGYRRRLEQLLRRSPEANDDVAFTLKAIEPMMQAATDLPLRAKLSAHLQGWLSLTRKLVDDMSGLGGSEVFEIIARMLAGAIRVGDRAAPVELFALVRLLEHELGRQPWLDDDTDVDDRAVELTIVPELAGRSFDLVVVVGAVDGELPRPGAAQQSLLADVDRVHLNGVLARQALPVTTHDETAAGAGLETVWWLLALRAAQQRVLISAPRRGARGREQAPSPWVFDAARALGCSAEVLFSTGLAGKAVPLASDRRQQLALRAKAAVADASVVDDDGVAVRARHTSMMIAQRDHWYTSSTLSYAERRAPYAFAVDPKRIARTFGWAFGLQKDRPLTPTRLEALADCRMHGFMQQVLRLDTDVEPGNAIEARVAGTLAHTVLERYYTERAQRKVPFVRFDDNDRVRLASLVDEEGTRELQRATGHLPALQAAMSFLKSNLLRVVAHLSRHPPVDGVEPRDFELQIGARSGGKAPTLAAVPITLAAGRNIHLGGVIDRVDDGVGGRAVVDYKTMSAARVKEKAAPKTLFESHFQLLIYLRLLEHHRPTTTATPLHGYLVSLKDGVTSNDVGTTELLRERLFDDNRDDSLGAAIGRVILPILDGTVPPDAGDRCSDCRLQRICRVPQEGAFAPDPDEREDDGATP